MIAAFSPKSSHFPDHPSRFSLHTLSFLRASPGPPASCCLLGMDTTPQIQKGTLISCRKDLGSALYSFHLLSKGKPTVFFNEDMEPFLGRLWLVTWLLIW